ncbi:MAG: TetR/AcrR family transcriptional regulator [Pseudomonadota bacterium]
MKTRDRILEASRLLFNEEGEADQSAVDIANVLNISPGNLYYHFKGKDAIIRALYDEFDAEMRIVLAGSRGRIRSIEDNWVYAYILLEETYDFRFFYRNLGPLLDRYPDLAGRFRRLVKDKRAAIRAILTELSATGVIYLEDRLAEALTDQLLKTVVFWLSLEQIEESGLPPAHLIHKTVFQMMLLVVPYMGAEGEIVLRRMIKYYERAVH